MSIIKWKTNIGTWSSSDKIERVECTRETAKCVWPLVDMRSWAEKTEGTKPPCMQEGPRRDKGSDYHDTWEAAHATLLADAERRLDSARMALTRAQGHHGNVKGMKKPEGAA
jgi:hypothetical protein